MFIYSLKNILLNKKYYIINFIFILIISLICNYCFFTVNAISVKMFEIKNELSNRYTFTDENGYDAKLSVPDLSKISNINLSDKSFSKDEILNFCESEYVDSFVLIYSSTIHTDYFEYNNQNTHKDFIPIEGYFSDELYDLNMIDEFRLGITELIEGHMFEKDNEIIISDILAETYQFSLNDMVKIPNLNKEFIIVGIYTEKHNIYSPDIFIRKNHATNNESINIIYTTFDTVIPPSLLEISIYNVYSIFNISSAENADKFYDEILGKGYPKDLYIKNDRTFNSMLTHEMDLMQGPLFLLYIFSLPVGAVILLLLTLIMLNGRKYEFAVLMSMGMSKFKLIANLLAESLLFIIGTLTLGIAVSRLTSPLILSYFYPRLSMWYNVKIAFSSTVLLQYFCYAMALVIISVFIFTLYISRFSPMRLLSDEK